MWQQVKPFNQSTAGKTKNMCLANVRSGYQIKNILPDAWTAWQNTEQHTDTPPTGVDVPIFFSYTATIDGQRKNWGHIGVQLKNGKFWSDGVTYNNIAAYTANHSPKYVGWGESVNNERVIKPVASPQGGNDMADASDVKHLYRYGPLGRAADAGGLKHYTGKKTDFILHDMANSKEAKDKAAKRAQELKDLKAYADKATRIAEERLVEINRLRAELAQKPTQPSDPDSVTITKDGFWTAIKNLFGKKG